MPNKTVKDRVNIIWEKIAEEGGGLNYHEQLNLIQALQRKLKDCEQTIFVLGGGD